jgi:hypothetical protein
MPSAACPPHNPAATRFSADAYRRPGMSGTLLTGTDHRCGRDPARPHLVAPRHTLTVCDAVGIDFLQASNELLEILEGATGPDATWAKLVDAIYVKHVEPSNRRASRPEPTPEMTIGHSPTTRSTYAHSNTAWPTAGGRLGVDRLLMVPTAGGGNARGRAVSDTPRVGLD